jgi:hypothetical protein
MPRQQSTAAKAGKTAAQVGAAVGVALLYVVIRRIVFGFIAMVLIVFGFYVGNIFGGGIWFLIWPAALLVGFWVALRYIRLPSGVR